jgi:hypothetical protein
MIRSYVEIKNISMGWLSQKGDEILPAVLTGLFVLIFLLGIRYFTKIDDKKITPIYNELPRRKIPLEENDSDVATRSITGESYKPDTTHIDKPEPAVKPEVTGDYYIIIGSFKTLSQAQEGAAKIAKLYNADIIVLPPTKEGNYRISYGRYPTPEDAALAISNVREKVKSDAWIFKVNE